MAKIILTAEERTTYTARLTSAEDAYHALLTGTQARVFVDQNGERVEFSAANKRQLHGYIVELRTKLGLANGVVGPLNPWML